MQVEPSSSSSSSSFSTCSRCLPIETSVTPKAWTLSILSQIKHDTSTVPISSRNEMIINSNDTNELLKQYHSLQVLFDNRS